MEHSGLGDGLITRDGYQSVNVSPMNSIRNSISVPQHEKSSELRLSFENKKSASFQAQKFENCLPELAAIPYNKMKYIPKVKEEFLFSKLQDHLRRFPNHKNDHVLTNIKLANKTNLYNDQMMLFKQSQLNKIHLKNLEILSHSQKAKETAEHLASKGKAEKWHDFRQRRQTAIDDFLLMKRKQLKCK
jgi:hypothetical protein